MQKLMKLALLGVAGWGSLACGSDPSTIETEEQAREAYAALDAQLVLVLAELEYDENGSGAAELPCEGGGTSRVSVSANRGSGQSGTGYQESTVESCRVGNLVMDGEVNSTATASVSGQVVTIDGSVEGTVTFDGEPEGVCYMKLSVQTSSSGGGAKVSGTICGFPAADILGLD